MCAPSVSVGRCVRFRIGAVRPLVGQRRKTFAHEAVRPCPILERLSAPHRGGWVLHGPRRKTRCVQRSHILHWTSHTLDSPGHNGRGILRCCATDQPSRGHRLRRKHAGESSDVMVVVGKSRWDHPVENDWYPEIHCAPKTITKISEDLSGLSAPPDPPQKRPWIPWQKKTRWCRV